MNMNTTPATFEEGVDIILGELRDLMIRKQRDYGPGNIMAFGRMGIVVRMNDKIERLKHLMKTGRLDDPENESANDSMQDLSNYGIIDQLVARGWFTLPMEAKAASASTSGQ